MPSTESQQTVVWIIDDDDVESLLIKEALLRTMPDCIMHAVGTAEAASDSLADESIPRPHLVILDYFLPRTEAPTLLPTLRAALGWTPIVVLSALSEKADVERCFAAQASLFIPKPPSYSGLSTALARVCEVYLNIAVFP